jgi:hypothetical protein
MIVCDTIEALMAGGWLPYLLVAAWVVWVGVFVWKDWGDG